MALPGDARRFVLDSTEQEAAQLQVIPVSHITHVVAQLWQAASHVSKEIPEAMMHKATTSWSAMDPYQWSYMEFIFSNIKRILWGLTQSNVIAKDDRYPAVEPGALFTIPGRPNMRLTILDLARDAAVLEHVALGWRKLKVPMWRHEGGQAIYNAELKLKYIYNALSSITENYESKVTSMMPDRYWLLLDQLKPAIESWFRHKSFQQLAVRLAVESRLDTGPLCAKGEQWSFGDWALQSSMGPSTARPVSRFATTALRDSSFWGGSFGHDWVFDFIDESGPVEVKCDEVEKGVEVARQISYDGHKWYEWSGFNFTFVAQWEDDSSSRTMSYFLEKVRR